MQIRIEVFISDNEWRYDTEDEAGCGTDLQDYRILSNGIVLILKDGSEDHFMGQNVSYGIFKMKEKGDLIIRK